MPEFQRSPLPRKHNASAYKAFSFMPLGGYVSDKEFN
jgi:hypothetical protein